jgi:carbamoyltransferase
VKVLGLSAFFHDSSATLVHDGKVVAAAEEERFTRVKHEARFPQSAARFCLASHGLTIEDVDFVVCSQDPVALLSRLASPVTSSDLMRRATSASNFLSRGIWLREHIVSALGRKRGGLPVFTVPHHLAHAASAFYPSPFASAAVVVADAVGEWSTLSIGEGRGDRLRLLARQIFPHSVGMLYAAATTLCGFKANSDEYKLMGLAAYGTPRFREKIMERVGCVNNAGNFCLHETFVERCRTASWEDALRSALDIDRRPEKHVTVAVQADVAASVQDALESALCATFQQVVRLTGLRRAVYAGGLALNVAANTRLIREGIVDELWIQPAAGDAGGSLGAALFGFHVKKANEAPRRRPVRQDGQKRSRLGPSFSNAYVRAACRLMKAEITKCRSRAALAKLVAEQIADGTVLGLFEGGMEFGPRALGGRSIIASPLDDRSRTRINALMKGRELFRPLGAAVIAGGATFLQDVIVNGYMLFTAQVRRSPDQPYCHSILHENGIEVIGSSRAPAITHADWSCRVQCVSPNDGLIWHIIESFRKLTDCAAIVNTSFNEAGEPIVCTPEEAFDTASRMNLDGLVINRYFVKRWRVPDGYQREPSPPDDNVREADPALVSKLAQAFGEVSSVAENALTPDSQFLQEHWDHRALRVYPSHATIVRSGLAPYVSALAETISDECIRSRRVGFRPVRPSTTQYAIT